MYKIILISIYNIIITEYWIKMLKLKIIIIKYGN